MKHESQNDTCPECESDNVSNEDAPDQYDQLQLTCHDCSHQWEIVSK